MSVSEFDAATRGDKYFAASGNRSVSDNGVYPEFCAAAASNAEAFRNFKSRLVYRHVVEGVSPEQGRCYLDILKSEAPDLLDRVTEFKANDAVGEPLTAEYPETGHISPTTLRYMKVASDLRRTFGEFKSIAEVGCGYGGQLLVADKIFSLERWTCFDLPPVLELIARCVESHILRGAYRTSTLNQFAGDEQFDLAISNYAFSELPSALQRAYISKVFSKSRSGYLTMNSGHENSAFLGDKLSLEELRSLLPKFEIIEERPLTASHNYIIVWGRAKF